ncbi:CAAX amino terminal protease self- immunity [Clostridium saccharobutylicum]|uniref:CPBP family glutamic-type intramembrane protease n=1 Tax=Clostridium saccharobutylicum TaxID=169679 RepID=UPI000983EEED|nr:CPBP family glutamic-type intramembrane protease [Clostridium saccharobutylicum]AQS08278.1 CAAX amino terminal protease self- immunity [Clostridium saccharobutylicum]MBC2435835.1 CPBP family intramembrane metalloprotease [Clostridium saccharobutylicum]NSB88358.1 hypothetical protein [Clostridium saccharobutylicum]NYC29395.1 hypothetical protein [Clostridium saccharobutylicum]OOM10924.1 CAAX amino terminal protease self- immunity [Clostridium saccharobutylicum]
MKNSIRSIESKLNDVQYILLAVMTSILIEIPLQGLIHLYEKYGGDLGSNYMEHSITFVFISGCIIGPIIESFFIIFLIWILKTKLHIKKKSHLLLITSAIFALLHYYSIIYIISVFPGCFIIVYSYLCYAPKKLSSFTVMLLVHIIGNSIEIMLSLL